MSLLPSTSQTGKKNATQQESTKPHAVVYILAFLAIAAIVSLVLCITKNGDPTLESSRIDKTSVQLDHKERLQKEMNDFHSSQFRLFYPNPRIDRLFDSKRRKRKKQRRDRTVTKIHLS
jgi:hypothetical protein